jgi:DNA-binding Lrp family transcriptional regulator
MAALDQGLTARKIAALFGIDPRSVRRRLRRLTRRVLSDRFAFVMRHRETWPASRRRIATACILQGRPIRAAAVELKTSLYNVRKQLDAVSALLDAFAPPKPPAHDSPANSLGPDPTKPNARSSPRPDPPRPPDPTPTQVA